MCAPILDRMSGRMTTLPTLVSVLNVGDGSKARTVLVLVVIADHLLHPSMGEKCDDGTGKKSHEPRDQIMPGGWQRGCRVEHDMVNLLDEEGRPRFAHSSDAFYVDETSAARNRKRPDHLTVFEARVHECVIALGPRHR